MKLKCQRCSYEWDYKGENEWVAYCPHCSIKVTIRKNKIEE